MGCCPQDIHRGPVSGQMREMSPRLTGYEPLKYLTMQFKGPNSSLGSNGGVHGALLAELFRRHSQNLQFPHADEVPR
jgi:hypothetical protein